MWAFNLEKPKRTKRGRQVLKAVDVGELGNAWQLILRSDKQSFAA